MTIIAYTLPDGSRQIIQMDAIVSVNISDSVTITEHPIEDGSKINDHVIPNGPSITMECWISNTPVRPPTEQNDGVFGSFQSLTIGTFSRQPKRGINPTRDGNTLTASETVSSVVEVKATVLSYGAIMDRVKQVYDLLKSKMDEGQAFTISTKMRDFSNMLIQSIEAPIGKAGTNAIKLSIAFKEVNIVSTLEVAAKPRQQRAKKKDAPGPQATTGDAATASLASNVYDSLNSVFK